MKKLNLKRPTLTERLAIITEEREGFRGQAASLSRELFLKDQRFGAYKRRAETQLEWYCSHIQALVSKIPGGAGR